MSGVSGWNSGRSAAISGGVWVELDALTLPLLDIGAGDWWWLLLHAVADDGESRTEFTLWELGLLESWAVWFCNGGA